MEESRVYSILSRSHLFKALDEDDFDDLVSRAEWLQAKSGERIYSAGDDAEVLYFITKGKVKIKNVEGSHPSTLGVLSEGDFFGLECFRNPSRRIFDAIAEGDLQLIYLAGSLLWKFAEHNEQFLQTLTDVVLTRESPPNQDTDWKDEDEFILFYCRKHPIFLWIAWALPLLIALLGFFLLVVGLDAGWLWLWLSGALITIFAVGLGVWAVVDYYNDAVVVTTRRVVWMEKVLGIYDARQEAPFPSIRAMDYTTTWLSRWIGFGTITVRTYTGNITLRDIHKPHLAMDLIEEYRQKAMKKRGITQEQILRQTLRRELGLEDAESEAKGSIFAPTSLFSKNLSRGGEHQKRWEGIFKLRLEDAEGVTFRKHWVILIGKIWLPVLGMLMVLWGFISYLLSGEMIKIIPPLEGSLFFLILMVGCGLWAAYHFIDWSNDIYRVTSEQIIDMEKKPLGREDRKTASLESVLSVSVERRNLLGLIFNFGNVKIDAGGTLFTFDNIADPNAASIEISNRVERWRERNEQAKVVEENRRYLEWLAAYHKEIMLKNDVQEEQE